VSVSGFGSPSTGQFTLETSEVSRTLTAGQPATGEIDGSDVVSFTFDVPDDGSSVLIAVEPESSLDPVIEIVGPDGQVQTVDDNIQGGPESALVATAGPHLLAVRGFDASAGEFTVVSSLTQTSELAPGDSVPAAGPVLFDVVVSIDQVLELTADPSSDDTSVVMQVYDADGVAIDFASGGPGEPASVLVDGVLADTYRVFVNSSGGDGDYTVTLSEADPDDATD
jgi:hypothetical protein